MKINLEKIEHIQGSDVKAENGCVVGRDCTLFNYVVGRLSN